VSRPVKDARPKPNPTIASTQAETGVKRKAFESLVKEEPKISRSETHTPVSKPVLSRKPDSAGSNPSLVATNPAEKKPTPPTKSVELKKPAAKPVARPILTPKLKMPEPTGPPKKGSFAETMARAQNLQNTKLGQSIRIVHKKTEVKKEETKGHAKLKAQREREATRNGTKLPDKRGESLPGGKKQIVKPERKLDAPGHQATAARKRPDGPKSTYQGTSGYQGTARRQDSLQKPAQRAQHRRYSDDDEDDEEGSYDSAASSDMEAGVFDIDEEEEAAERLARREDAAAAAEEREHQRRKLARKFGGGS
jgi:hypothetical protein